MTENDDDDDGENDDDTLISTIATWQHLICKLTTINSSLKAKHVCLLLSISCDWQDHLQAD